MFIAIEGPRGPRAFEFYIYAFIVILRTSRFPERVNMYPIMLSFVLFLKHDRQIRFVKC